MVQEFFTGIIIDKKGIFKEDPFAENGKNMYVHICERDNIISARTLRFDNEEGDDQETKTSDEDVGSDEEKDESEDDDEDPNEDKSSEDEIDEEIEARSDVPSSIENVADESSASSINSSDSAELDNTLPKTKRARTKHADKDDTPSKMSKKL
ncbi:hypothetical protein COLO4_19689 [Corchorus olitorius]|uniref:Uncharacterized protein n=1 Tax=Corchorus olitorius TaxID=93759 RepID=A0A1R3J406_9ROSI|nr:hypothetical protein COLO4_19689 [Corchorus olitorius]